MSGLRGRRRGGMTWLEVQHGDTIAATGEDVWNWSSPAGQARFDARVELFVETLGLRWRRKKVLELGCGTGLYTERIAPLCGSLTSADISRALLDQAGVRLKDTAVRLVEQDLEAIDAAALGGGFEAVFGCSVLHHLDLDRTLPRLRPLLAPGAELAFSEPNLLNPLVQVMFSGVRWAREKWAVSRTEMAFYPWELRSIFERHGFEVIALFPFDFIYPSAPAPLVPHIRALGRWLERTPGLRFLGGSCFIHARPRAVG